MSLDYLTRFNPTSTPVAEQVRKSHSLLPKEKCAAWQHARKHSGKEGGCDIHGDDG